MIQIKNLSKNFKDKSIFDKVNLKIPSNKITFVVGQSGIGKTTLINLIANFTKKDEGEILFYKDGRQIKNPLIDVVFQDFNLIDQLSARSNIKIANNILNRATSANLLEKSAEFLDIKRSKLDQDVRNLSGGEKQRIAILRAFSRDSDFILLDEPTGNLDEENATLVFENLCQLSKNKTILVVTHNLKFAKKYADQIIEIGDGYVNTNQNIKFGQSLVNPINSNFILDSEQNKKTSISSKLVTSFSLVFADIKTKITTFVLIILAFLLFVFGSVLFIILNLSVSQLNLKKVREYNVDTINISRTFPTIRFLKNEQKEILNGNSTIEKLIPVYPGAKNITFSYSKKIAASNLIAPIDESNFFKERLYDEKSNISGNFIKNENEIIISENVIRELQIENPIGKKINVIFYQPKNLDNKRNGFNSQDPTKIQATIVGINHKKVFQNHSVSYLHHNLIKSIIEEEYMKNRQANPFNSISWLDKNYKNTPAFSLPFIKQGNNEISEFYYENQPEINKFKLLKGEFPKDYNEVAISSNYVINEIPSNDLIGNFLEINTRIPHQNLVFKIVGIFEQENKENKKDNDFSGVAIFNHKVQQIEKTLHPSSLQLYFSNNNLYKNIEDFEKNNPNFLISGGPKRTLSLLVNLQTTLQFILFGVLVIFTISFLVFIGFFSKNLSFSKQKSIAILKALGAKTKKILFYHWLDLFTISILVLFLGLVFVIPIIPEIYKIISEQDFAQPSYTQVTAIFLITWIIMFVILTLIYLLTSRKTYKKPVTSLLNN